MHRLLLGDVLSFARHYTGEPFHALLCDAPYHLTTITDRFGKEGSAQAQYGKDGAFQRTSRGFMNALWDGGDISFQPETWKALGKLLYPGAFGMTFGGSRTAHRMAVAIEDAGFIIHPMIGWVYGSGFPKATRIKDAPEFEGHRYGLQTLKPALEPIIVFQKPYPKGVRPIDSITKIGAGALNIDGGRIGTNKDVPASVSKEKTDIIWGKFAKGGIANGDGFNPNVGRWPSNFVLTHSPNCQLIGYRNESYQINRFTDGAKPFGDGAGHEFDSEEIESGTPVWDCVEGCPVKELDRQSGHLKSGTGAVKKATSAGHQGNVCGSDSRPFGTPNIEYGDSGGASRFFHQSFYYQAKAGVAEREAGLRFHIPCLKCGELDSLTHIDEDGEIRECRRCGHPTIKPIELIRHLATLLLPPEEYKPRRLFVPFAGTASEMIGTFQAGWECVIGVEMEKEYVDIGRARLQYWLEQGVQLDLFSA